ncbi:hypothetical protein [Microcystis phage Mvi-JY20]|uniref:Uncharacterized protein n=1 Tax=Microcystis phage Mvi-JY20 TaxID=3128146 RepID=A0AAX4QGA7_9CAUD
MFNVVFDLLTEQYDDQLGRDVTDVVKASGLRGYFEDLKDLSPLKLSLGGFKEGEVDAPQTLLVFERHPDYGDILPIEVSDQIRITHIIRYEELHPLGVDSITYTVVSYNSFGPPGADRKLNIKLTSV